MAQLDKFIQAMLTKPGAELLLAANQEPSIVLNGAASSIMQRKPTAQQVRHLVAEITPQPARQTVQQSGGASFDYQPPGLQPVSIHIESWSGDTRVQIRPQTQQLEAQELDLDDGLSVPPMADPSAAQLEATAIGTAAIGTAAIGTSAYGSNGSAGYEPAASLGAAAVTHPIDELFVTMVQSGASDMHLSSEEIPMLRKDGDMVRFPNKGVLGADELARLLDPIVPEQNREEFASDNDTDFAYEISGLARFRANMFRDRKGVGAVFRTIPAEILTAEQLGLPDAVQNLCGLHKGLVLVTGPTGSGKSTTLCALIDLINRTRSGHIITIEDPIEFVHQNKKCLINQREVGVHTDSFKRALRAALREDPDIVLVGEMRDLETISIAIETAETGHLVFGTLHTTTAYSTVDRIIDQYPPDQQEQIRVMLSESLKGVVSQTLCKRIGGGRVAALEVLLATPAVANLIREGKTFQIPSIMQTSRKLGMALLNESLLELVKNRQVAPEEAMAKAIDKSSLKTMLQNLGMSVELSA